MVKILVPLSANNKILLTNKFLFQGYKYMFDDSLVTVWSAPNYCYRSLCARNKCHIKDSCVFRCGNVASILQFTDADNRTPKLFEAVPDDKRVIPARQVDLERT